jgi:hypothetical protein
MEFSHWRGDRIAAPLKNAKSSACFDAAAFTFRHPYGPWLKPGETSSQVVQVSEKRAKSTRL